MIINHNLSAMNAHRNMASNLSALSKSSEKLSSGLRINRAGDDAAGLAISEKMRGQINGLDTAARNSQDGISLVQTAEGALNETHSILQRMRELAVQASNDTNVTTDRDAVKTEMGQLSTEITRISTQTQFNTQNLLDGSFTGKTLQIGANVNQQITVGISGMGATALGVSGLAVSTAATATQAISTIDKATAKVSTERATLGAYQNRLEHTINNLNTSSENLSSAESRIRDVDMAKEMMSYSKNNILVQASQSMLAQANQTPQGVLQLLK